MKLKPCPFCGGKAEMMEATYLGIESSVICFSCGASGPTVFSEDKAAERWNNRKEPKGEKQIPPIMEGPM